MISQRADDLFPDTLPPHTPPEPPDPPRLTLRPPSWAVYQQLKAQSINAVKPMNQIMWDALVEYWQARGLLTGAALENHPESVRQVAARLKITLPGNGGNTSEPPVQLDLFENCSQ